MEAAYRIYDLRCLNRSNPRGIDENPRFSWKLAGKGQDIFQKQYRICVWEEERLIWDSGRVFSDATFGIPYHGPALKTGTDYSWQEIGRAHV